MSLSWMAWTWQTATFFILLAMVLAGMGLWEWKRPGGNPRRGIFGLDTTRGDRLFITLLGSGFIALGWLSFIGSPPYGALVICALWAIFVFRRV
ncbi:DUF2160 domain-containing protein [Thioalkalivibrio sp. HK1]|uniref:DUF2160 domain-containing protein n=1 Tax=Thioalkalivibrio sp. HK1 TaxID=1469245 RepID=UPI0004727407|nr:DUF2160 domain-containing protein [Thioalkalivibrio sp. HK1]